MDNSTKMVSDFHEAFGIKQVDKPVTLRSTEEVRSWLQTYANVLDTAARSAHHQAARTKSPLILRAQLMIEELGELLEALAKDDIVDALDALCDMRYVNDGTALVLGLGDVFPHAFEEVQRSNMSKLDADGRPVLDKAGRVQKPDTYSPPDIAGILERETEI